MKKSTLQIIALLTVVIYSAIAISSLAAFAAKGDIVARAGSGECTGECASCGCSLERSISKTCCCDQKRQKDSHYRENGQPECGMKTEADAAPPILTACPCGKKTFAIWGEDEFQLLSDRFHSTLTLLGKPLDRHPSQSLTSRYSDPPDKPPKLPRRC